MPIRAISNIEPYNNSPFPVTEDVYVKGGYRVVGTFEDLGKIPELHLKYGMLAYVQDEDKTYRLDKDLTTWYEQYNSINEGQLDYLTEFVLDSNPMQWVINTVTEYTKDGLDFPEVACVLAVYLNGVPQPTDTWTFDVATGQLTLDETDTGDTLQALVVFAPTWSKIAPILPVDPNE